MTTPADVARRVEMDTTLEALRRLTDDVRALNAKLIRSSISLSDVRRVRISQIIANLERELEMFRAVVESKR